MADLESDSRRMHLNLYQSGDTYLEFHRYHHQRRTCLLIRRYHRQYLKNLENRHYHYLDLGS